MKANSPFPNPAFLNEAADKLSALLKQSPAKDIEQNIKAGLTSMLGKLDLVTREEFDEAGNHLFALADANHDGVVDATEMRQVAQRMQSLAAQRSAP